MLNCSNISSTLCRNTSKSNGHNTSFKTTAAQQISKTAQGASTAARQESTEDDISPDLYVTTVFTGRLGNHMCIYAALLGIARANNRRAFIRSGTVLDQYFNLTHVNNSIDTHGWTTLRQQNYAQFYPSFFNLPKQNITLWGLFRSWKFLVHAEEEIRSEFTFRSEIRQERDELFRKLRKERGDVIFVGVHVRRGDFLIRNAKNVGLNSPQVSYFLKAFKTMRAFMSNSSLLFVVASDDLGWCEKNLKASDVLILNRGSPGLHLAILAGCDHSVISGGSYSWWGALLANGTTIYYAGYPSPGSTLSRSFVQSDVFPPSWIPHNN